jgi:hypothetical protein
MDFKDCNWVSMRRKCNTHSTCVCSSHTEGKDTIQWRGHNCSHWMRAMENVTRQRTRIWIFSTECPRSTAWLDKCHLLWKAHSLSDDCPLHLTVHVSTKRQCFGHSPCTIWWWRVFRNLIVSGFMLHNIVQKSIHTIESLRDNLLPHCIASVADEWYVSVQHWGIILPG